MKDTRLQKTCLLHEKNLKMLIWMKFQRLYPVWLQNQLIV